MTSKNNKSFLASQLIKFLLVSERKVYNSKKYYYSEFCINEKTNTKVIIFYGINSSNQYVYRIQCDEYLSSNDTIDGTTIKKIYRTFKRLYKKYNHD